MSTKMKIIHKKAESSYAVIVFDFAIIVKLLSWLDTQILFYVYSISL